MSKALRRLLFNVVFVGTLLSLFIGWYWDYRTKNLIDHIQVNSLKEDIAFQKLVAEIDSIAVEGGKP